MIFRSFNMNTVHESFSLNMQIKNAKAKIEELQNAIKNLTEENEELKKEIKMLEAVSEEC